MRDSPLPDRKRGRRLGRRLRWSRKRGIEQVLEILARLLEANEKVGNVSPLSNFFRQLGNAGVRYEAGDTLGALLAGVIAVVADVDFGNISEFFRPIFLQHARAGR